MAFINQLLEMDGAANNTNSGVEQLNLKVKSQVIMSL